MARSLTSKNLLEKKPGEIVRIDNPVLSEAIGTAERNGCWLVYGPDKNGKTWLALQLAKELAKGEKVAYISAEEGVEKSFKDACIRAGITAADKVLWDEYMGADEIIEKFNKPRTAGIIIIDNLTMYQDEIKPLELKKKFIDAIPGKLIILLAHEERNEAYPAVARMAKKMAKVIINVRGLRATVTSRFSVGGTLIIDEEKCAICWGENKENN